ncbi:MAG: hypothetical protein IJL12_08085 [Selenomonadaceae bacterium]|nr:hypothetical protein [Selenomonadaceae bacterium]
MIEISNLRKYRVEEGIVRLEVDINFLGGNPYPVKTMYFDSREDCGDMFSEDTYDAFVLVPLFLAMYNKIPLKICGKISKKFYKNLTWYAQKILCDFLDKLAPVDIFVEGFAPTKSEGYLIGAPLSCGVDSLSTVYDRYINENDPDYKINALFIFNNGTHGSLSEPVTKKFFQSRIERVARAANELRLPLLVINSNLDKFCYDNDLVDIAFLINYSCVLSLQNAIRRYYVPGAYSYQDIKEFGRKPHDYDLAAFCDSYFVPLIQTERTEFIIDGCQYRRVDKVKRIADWEIAQKYLNVCCKCIRENSDNCGECDKCERTLLTLDILGKLNNFSEVFDLDKYRRDSFNIKIKTVHYIDKNALYKENFDLAVEMNFPMPTKRECFVLDKNILVVK